jgi:hypothetical protein
MAQGTLKHGGKLSSFEAAQRVGSVVGGDLPSLGESKKFELLLVGLESQP